MNSSLKPAVLSVLAAVFLLAGSGANASAVLNDPEAISRNGLALSVRQDERDDPPCNLAPLMKLTGSRSRSHAGSWGENPRSAPAMTEPPVFVKNPFLSIAP
jgi:hypothetical protein